MRRTAVLVLLLSGVAHAQEDDPWFAPDKALHFGVTAGLSSAGYLGASLLTDDMHTRFIVGASLALAAGIGKEVFDALVYGRSSFRDLAWDALGTMTGLVTTWFFERLAHYLQKLSALEQRRDIGAPWPPNS